jgi:hypothetical protein
LRDGQPVDRAPEKKRRAENFDGAKLARRRIFHGEFTAIPSILRANNSAGFAAKEI